MSRRKRCNYKDPSDSDDDEEPDKRRRETGQSNRGHQKVRIKGLEQRNKELGDENEQLKREEEEHIAQRDSILDFFLNHLQNCDHIDRQKKQDLMNKLVRNTRTSYSSSAEPGSSNSFVDGTRNVHAKTRTDNEEH